MIHSSFQKVAEVREVHVHDAVYTGVGAGVAVAKWQPLAIVPYDISIQTLSVERNCSDVIIYHLKLQHQQR
jgi:hypothetical protein